MDDVVLLDSNSIAFILANTSAISLEKLYRGVTAGDLIDSADDTSFTYKGVNLECLSPIYLNGSRSAANDWSLTWVRRSRIDVEWRDNVDVSLGETAEQYIVEFYTTSGYTVLKHTSATLTTPSYTYSSASQIADFGSVQTILYCRIYQLSSVVGRGYPLQATLSQSTPSVLLMHMDTTTLSDVYGHAVTLNGNAVRSATQSKFGGYAAFFDGTGDYLSLPNHADWTLGTGDFTIEMWVWFASMPAAIKMLVCQASGGMSLNVSATNKLAFAQDNVAQKIIGNTTVTASAWHHVAVTRQSSILRLFLNGVPDATEVTDTTSYGSANVLTVGYGNNGTQYPFNGYIDELRITKGTARYISNFAASLPTGPFIE